jgi:hypothetical protein
MIAAEAVEPGSVLTRLDPFLDLQHAWLAGYPYTRDPSCTARRRVMVPIPDSDLNHSKTVFLSDISNDGGAMRVRRTLTTSLEILLVVLLGAACHPLDPGVYRLTVVDVPVDECGLEYYDIGNGSWAELSWDGFQLLEHYYGNPWKYEKTSRNEYVWERTAVLDDYWDCPVQDDKTRRIEVESQTTMTMSWSYYYHPAEDWLDVCEEDQEISIPVPCEYEVVLEGYWHSEL